MAAVARPTVRRSRVPLHLILVLQPQAELNGTRLVTLSANGPKTRRPEETVGIAEVGAVEDVAQLSLEPQIESFLYRKDFEYVDVLVVGRECADGPVSPGCVAEQGIGGGGIKSWISPGCCIKVVVNQRIETAAPLDRTYTLHAIGPSLSVEQDSAEGVVHRDVHRSPTLIA